MTDGNQLVQITQTNFVFSQDDNVIAGNLVSALVCGSIRIFGINVICLQLAVTNEVALHTENQL